MSAADLIYRLRLESHSLHFYLRTLRAPDPRGRLAVEVIGTLDRCESLARSMTPFDPSGL